MGIQNQVGNKHESVSTGRQMGLNCVQGAKSSKTLKSIISNTRPCGLECYFIKYNKHSEQAQITLK